MINLYEPNSKLRDHFCVTEDFFDIDLLCFMEIRENKHTLQNVKRVINGLKRSGFHTLGDVLNLRWYQVSKITSLGKTSISLLISLLTKISNEPNLIINCPKYSFDVVHNPNPIFIEFPNNHTNRKEEILAKLREMGLVT